MKQHELNDMRKRLSLRRQAVCRNVCTLLQRPRSFDRPTRAVTFPMLHVLLKAECVLFLQLGAHHGDGACRTSKTPTRFPVVVCYDPRDRYTRVVCDRRFSRGLFQRVTAHFTRLRIRSQIVLHSSTPSLHNHECNFFPLKICARDVVLSRLGFRVVFFIRISFAFLAREAMIHVSGYLFPPYPVCSGAIAIAIGYCDERTWNDTK